jgi:glutamyl-tRNA reductase
MTIKTTIHYRPQFIVVGVNYKKTALDIRGKFAFTAEKIKQVYVDRQNTGCNNFFILSTCNRTEIYGIDVSPEALCNVFTHYREVSEEEIKRYVFVKKDDEAIHHLYRVASGLDSQILGDCEITAQLKNAFRLAKFHRCTGGYLEKLINSALQASREVRNLTQLSDGTTSVSYAVVQILRQLPADTLHKRICLIGIGKIGELTLKKIRHYLPAYPVTVVCRNESRAHEIMQRYSVAYVMMQNKSEAIQHADVLIVATASETPLISRSEIKNSSISAVIDLSVPSNVSADVRTMQGITFYDIDDLSEMINQTISKRATQVPYALEIIDKHVGYFKQWQLRSILYASLKPQRFNI